jgi:hypothetical protein
LRDEPVDEPLHLRQSLFVDVDQRYLPAAMAGRAQNVVEQLGTEPTARAQEGDLDRTRNSPGRAREETA